MSVFIFLSTESPCNDTSVFRPKTNKHKNKHGCSVSCRLRWYDRTNTSEPSGHDRIYWFNEQGVHWYARITDKGKVDNGRRFSLSRLRWFDSMEGLVSDTGQYKIMTGSAWDHGGHLILHVKNYGVRTEQIVAQQRTDDTPCGKRHTSVPVHRERKT